MVDRDIALNSQRLWFYTARQKYIFRQDEPNDAIGRSVNMGGAQIAVHLEKAEVEGIILRDKLKNTVQLELPGPEDRRIVRMEDMLRWALDLHICFIGGMKLGGKSISATKAVQCVSGWVLVAGLRQVSAIVLAGDQLLEECAEKVNRRGLHATNRVVGIWDVGNQRAAEILAAKLKGKKREIVLNPTELRCDKLERWIHEKNYSGDSGDESLTILAEIKRSDTGGELCGIAYDPDGGVVKRARATGGIAANELRGQAEKRVKGRFIVGVAAGVNVDAIIGAVRARLIESLIIDEERAYELCQHILKKPDLVLERREGSPNPSADDVKRWIRAQGIWSFEPPGTRHAQPVAI